MKLLIDDKGKKYLVDDKEELHTHRGVINLRDAKINTRITSHLGKSFAYLEANVCDIVEKLPKNAAPILKKDFGAMIANTGIGGGSRVAEAGTGNGILTMMLANIVKPSGRVYTYEIREDFFEKARENIKKAGMLSYVEMHLKDIRHGIDEKELDAVFLDMPDPWNAAEEAYRALKYGGFIVAYLPYIEQVRKTFYGFKEAGFREARAKEIIEREIEVKEEGTRPRTKMLGHSGYIVIARKY